VSAVSKPDSGGGVNKAGVAAGVVVGVVVLALIGVGAWIFLRRKRRQKIEEDYRKSAAVRGFVQKPASDHRLDPSMVQRRDSVGSIADNQDYSRRILKA
jgi:cell wall integrity and stress response component